LAAYQAAVEKARDAGDDAVMLAYTGAVTFWSYMDEYWAPMAEDWCRGGRERAAMAVGFEMAEQFPNTNNHLESFNNIFKNILRRYGLSPVLWHCNFASLFWVQEPLWPLTCMPSNYRTLTFVRKQLRLSQALGCS
jgi:hypothetical protein